MNKELFDQEDQLDEIFQDPVILSSFKYASMLHQLQSKLNDRFQYTSMYLLIDGKVSLSKKLNII